MKNKIEFIAFDADDTLWENELYFKSWNTNLSSSEEIFTSSFHIRRTVQNRNKNLHIYGYGLKGMLLCMIETICKVTNGEGDLNLVKEILRSGQELLQRPIILLDGVQEVISALCEIIN